jgi:hypothetical protein
MTNDHVTGAWALNIGSALFAQVQPIVGTISFCLAIAYTIYQWRRDAKKNTAEPKN